MNIADLRLSGSTFFAIYVHCQGRVYGTCSLNAVEDIAVSFGLTEFHYLKANG